MHHASRKRALRRVALATALDLSDADRDVALDTPLREADGFLVTPDGVAILSELSDESEDLHV